ncbi:amino acid permease-domain-containing protein [Chiua virens]|nr:amino acid permease-domain-containing protein [Chiua virens]
MAATVTSGSSVPHSGRSLSPSSLTAGKSMDGDPELHQPRTIAAERQRRNLDLGTMFSTTTGSEHETKRAMESRHLMMIAIGGTIGTGIFLSAGSAIALAGPGSALLSYAVVGVFVYAVVISLGEMAAMFPVSGAFSTFGTRFVSPALGFTLGWNYWFQWSLSIPSELTAAAVILQFWAPQVQPWQWALVIIAPVFLMQLIHVRVYGESEYWFASIKVALIILFIFVGLIYDWGGIKGHPGPGLSNFQNGQAFIGGFANFAQTFVYAFYSFGGVELVAVAAGESARPWKAVPSAVKATFVRIVLFYILTILTIGLCINWKDPTLLRAAYNSDVTASPLTVVFNGPALLGQVKHRASLGGRTSTAVPIPALLMSLAVSFLAFLTSIWGQGVVFTWLLNLTGISALLVWGSVGLISLRFRAAWKVQGRRLSDLPYTQPLFPLLPIGVIVLATVMFVAEGYSAVKVEPFSVRNVVATYIGIVLYIVLYVGYIMYERLVLGKRQHIVPLLEVDLESDAAWKAGDVARLREEEEEGLLRLPEAGARWKALLKRLM